MPLEWRGASVAPLACATLTNVDPPALRGRARAVVAAAAVRCELLHVPAQREPSHEYGRGTARAAPCESGGTTWLRSGRCRTRRPTPRRPSAAPGLRPHRRRSRGTQASGGAPGRPGGSARPATASSSSTMPGPAAASGRAPPRWSPVSARRQRTPSRRRPSASSPTPAIGRRSRPKRSGPTHMPARKRRSRTDAGCDAASSCRPLASAYGSAVPILDSPRLGDTRVYAHVPCLLSQDDYLMTHQTSSRGKRGQCRPTMCSFSSRCSTMCVTLSVTLSSATFGV